MEKYFTVELIFQVLCLYVLAMIPIYFGHKCIEFERKAQYPIDKWLGRIGYVLLIVFNAMMIAFMAPVFK